MLEAARQQAGLTPAGLWWAYFGLGGTATPLQLAGFLNGLAEPGPIDHDLLSVALNEHLTELGLNSPVPSFDAWTAP
jgi:hypothetical protein